MNQEETIALFERCETAREIARDDALAEGKDWHTADNAAHEAARAVWNGWAEEMLAERRSLEEAGHWAAGNNVFGDLEPRSEAARIWVENATANFSRLWFQVGEHTHQGGPHTEDNSVHEDTVEGIRTVCVRRASIRFDGFVFPSDTLFKETRFSGLARFEETQFSGVAFFHAAQFSGAAWFDRATFSNSAWFDTGRFLGGTQFRNAQFSGRAIFDHARFLGLAGFKDVHFFGRALFHKARFCGDAEFGGAQFSGRALFKEAQFAKAGFQWAQFETDALFTKATFSGDADFSLARFNYSADFADAHFGEGANFNAIRGEQAFSLANATFKTVPDFIQAHFSEAPRQDHMELKGIPELGALWQALGVKCTQETTSKYRALKRLALQGHDHERERMFFKGEMRARRFSEPEKPTIRFFNKAYDLFSDFGYSFWRPLGALLGLVGLCFVIHWGSASSSTYPDTWSAFFARGSAAFSLSWKNGLVALGGSRDQRVTDAYLCLYGEQFKIQATVLPGPGLAPASLTPTGTPAIPGWITFMESVQSLLSIILLFLMVLGVRNQFRIK